MKKQYLFGKRSLRRRYGMTSGRPPGGGKRARLQSLPGLSFVRVFFDCFDVPTHRALVGDQFRQTTDPRHAADGGQPFTVASAVVGQFLKFG